MLACGRNFTVAALEGSGALAWGTNSIGQLGLGGDMFLAASPTAIPALIGEHIAQVRADYCSHSVRSGALAT